MLARAEWTDPQTNRQGNHEYVRNNARTSDDFRRVLAIERARADRIENEFSVMLICGDVLGGAAGRERVINTLFKRLRIIDEIGWFDGRRIGVLLPDTAHSGAVKLAHDIRRLTMPALLGITVYTYPGRWLPEDTSELPIDNPPQRKAEPALGIEVGHATALFDDGMPGWKRAMDLFVGTIALLVLSPVFLLVAATILAVSPGHVFLKQKRVGYQGRLFTIWKFRTMKVGSDTSVHQQHFKMLMTKDVPLTKLDRKGDPRIIPLGHFIRRCCLDELPQLINVLRGDMSLVGPRPCLAFAVSQYCPWQRMRCDAYPGMTGLWQVSGKNSTTFKEMIRLDIAYVRRRSLRFDLHIILKTVPAILKELTGKASSSGKHSRVLTEEPQS